MSVPTVHIDSNGQRPLPLPWAAAFLAVIGFAALWSLIPSEYAHWDDIEQLGKNHDLLPPTLSGLGERWAKPYMNIYIPFTHTVWFALAWIGGEDPAMPSAVLRSWPFKLANILVHLATSTVVFCILRKLLRTRWLPLIGASLYCVHPVQVESIAWASGMKDLLMGLFGALCICFYLGDEARDYHLSARGYALAVVAMVLACLSKPTAFVLPAMLAVIDLFITKRPTTDLFNRLLPFGLLGIACAAYARFVQPPIDIGIHPTVLDRLLVSMHSYAFYLQKLSWPTDLAFDYGMNWHELLGSARLRVAWLVPVAVAGIAILIRRRFPLFGVGLLLASIPIAPVSGLVIFDYSYYSITADHYLYLPMVGVVISVAALIQPLPLKPVLIVLTGVFTILGVLTKRQADTWRTQQAAIEHILSVNPRSFSSYSVWAVNEVSASGGDPLILRRAEDHARKSLEIMPGNPRAIDILANVLSAQGRYEEALIEIDRAIRIAPNDVHHHMARAGILGELRRGPEAIQELRTVLRLEPEHRLARELVRKWDAMADTQRRQPTTLPNPGE